MEHKANTVGTLRRTARNGEQRNQKETYVTINEEQAPTQSDRQRERREEAKWN